jgi:hypothetical protein
VDQTVFIWIYFDAQMTDTMFRFKIQILDMNNISIIWAEDDFKWKKFELKKL